MEEKSFNETQFNNYLLRLIKDYQVGEITEYKSGAVSALLQVSDQFQQMTTESESNKKSTDSSQVIHLDREKRNDRE